MELGWHLREPFVLKWSPQVTGRGVRERGHQGHEIYFWEHGHHSLSAPFPAESYGRDKRKLGLAGSLSLISTKHGKPPAFSWRFFIWTSHSISFVKKLIPISPKQNRGQVFGGTDRAVQVGLCKFCLLALLSEPLQFPHLKGKRENAFLTRWL